MSATLIGPLLVVCVRRSGKSKWQLAAKWQMLAVTFKPFLIGPLNSDWITNIHTYAFVWSNFRKLQSCRCLPPKPAQLGCPDLFWLTIVLYWWFVCARKIRILIICNRRTRASSWWTLIYLVCICLCFCFYCISGLGCACACACDWKFSYRVCK